MLGDLLSGVTGNLTPRVVQEVDLSSLLAVPEVGGNAPDPNLWISAIRMFGALALVLALLVVSLWVLRRLSGRATASGKTKSAALEILLQRPLGGRRQLTVVRWQGRQILLGVTSDSITPLASEPDDLGPCERDAFRSELTAAYGEELPEETLAGMNSGQ